MDFEAKKAKMRKLIEDEYGIIPRELRTWKETYARGRKVLQYAKAFHLKPRSAKVKSIPHGYRFGVCPYCHTEDYLTRDHIKPRALGEKDEDDNIQLLCAICNNSKGHKTLESGYLYEAPCPKHGMNMFFTNSKHDIGRCFACNKQKAVLRGKAKPVWTSAKVPL